jgi:methyl-accepting chemotaxis protein
MRASVRPSACGRLGSGHSQTQSANAEAVEAIQQITATIGDISMISVRIARAVEQQGTATSEIARNAQT